MDDLAHSMSKYSKHKNIRPKNPEHYEWDYDVIGTYKDTFKPNDNELANNFSDQFSFNAEKQHGIEKLSSINDSQNFTQYQNCDDI